MNLFLFVAITVLSGLCDAYGFSQAALIWSEGGFSTSAAVKSGIGFIVGIALFWLALRFLGQLGITSATIGALAWFAITAVGTAVLSGDFRNWDGLTWGLAITSMIAIAGLLYQGR